MQMKKKVSNTNKQQKEIRNGIFGKILNIQIGLHALQSWVTKPNEQIWYFLYIFYIQLHLVRYYNYSTYSMRRWNRTRDANIQSVSRGKRVISTHSHPIHRNKWNNIDETQVHSNSNSFNSCNSFNNQLLCVCWFILSDSIGIIRFNEIFSNFSTHYSRKD